MSENYTCDFCKKILSSAKSLDNHQKSAKYCLTIQQKEVSEKNKCDGCYKNFCNRSWLNQHHLNCLDYQILVKTELLVNENNQLKIQIETLQQAEKDKLREKNEYIAKLEAKLEKFENAVTNMAAATTLAMEAKAARASSTTNNTTNNITVTTNNVLNLSQEHVNKLLSEQLDYNVVYAGQAGLAKFVVDKMLKNQAGKLIYRCVDPSRQMFEFVDENGETVRDMKADKLIQSLLEGNVINLGLDAAKKGWNTEDTNLNTDRYSVFGAKVSEYADLNRNNTVFRSKVSSLTT